MGDFLKPSAKGRRDELSNAKENGRIMNPPRMAALGGLKSANQSNAMRRNDLKIKRPNT